MLGAEMSAWRGTAGTSPIQGLSLPRCHPGAAPAWSPGATCPTQPKTARTPSKPLFPPPPLEMTPFPASCPCLLGTPEGFTGGPRFTQEEAETQRGQTLAWSQLAAAEPGCEGQRMTPQRDPSQSASPGGGGLCPGLCASQESRQGLEEVGSERQAPSSRLPGRCPPGARREQPAFPVSALSPPASHCAVGDHTGVPSPEEVPGCPH